MPGIKRPQPAKFTLALLVMLFAMFGSALHAAGPVAGDSAEARAARAFELARKQGPPALRVFLSQMPKGADLHVHLAGAVYAETWLAEAIEDGVCVNAVTLSLDKSTLANDCKQGELPGSSIGANQKLYDDLIDAFSMRSFVPVTGESGHDHFFATFARFGDLDRRHQGELLDEVAVRAAAQNEQYLELMDTPAWQPAAALAQKIGFTENFRKYRDDLLAAGIDQQIPAIRAAIDKSDGVRKAREHCGTPEAQPACQVQLRYLFQVLRGLPRTAVFAQVVLAFELASVEPRVVGLNFVMPEDGIVSMRDYRLQMNMLDALAPLYPKVHISLHAGELTEGLVPPEGLRFHIRSAIEQGHAERIGHGVDVLYEDRPQELLKEMAAKHILVEVNLTSNDVILGVAGKDHPLPGYLAAHVPVALSTDDEGVSRIDLTHEYVRAADTYDLSYQQLKQMVRASLEHSFLPGESLWQRTEPESFTKPEAACRVQMGQAQPSGACAELVKASERAQQQWELEHRFQVFEANF